MNKTVQDIQKAILAINGLLAWSFVSPQNRRNLETFKAELEAELDSILDKQANAQAAN